MTIAARGVERGQAAEQRLRAEGGEASFVRADVSVPGEIEALVKSVVERFGRLDYACNNAAALIKAAGLAAYEEADSQKIEEVLAGYAARVPLGRIGRPDEAAEAILWLCGSAASYVTGQSMIVDGGLTAWAR